MWSLNLNSWDCFDTLIARRFYDPKTVFDEVGSLINDPGFREKRIRAEKKSKIKSYEDIYKSLPQYDPNIELEVELKHNFPIVENIQKVKDGDLILSDMYLPADFVMKLLRNCGLTANVDIIVTPDGKKKGWVWESVKSKYNIQNHYGDNYKSDVVSAKNYNINGIHTTVFDLNSIEKYVYNFDKHLASFMRELRLCNPYTDNDHKSNIWNDQANYNIPILSLISSALPKNKKLCFTYRDCVHLQKIHNKLYPNVESVEFLSSRYILRNPSEEYKEYVNSIVDSNSLVIDLNGRGTSLNLFFNGNPPETLLVTVAEDPLDFPEKLTDNLCALEVMNSSYYKQIVCYDKTGPLFGTYERDYQDAVITHEVIDVALAVINNYNLSFNKSLLNMFVEEVKKTYTYNNIRWRTKVQKSSKHNSYEKQYIPTN